MPCVHPDSLALLTDETGKGGVERNILAPPLPVMPLNETNGCDNY